MIIGFLTICCIFLLLVPLPKQLYWKKALIVFCLYSSLSFYYYPDPSQDLYRYYTILDVLKSGSGSSLQLLSTYRLENPVFLIIMKFISLLGINQLLPFLISILCFGIYIFIIKDIFSGFEEKYMWKQSLCLCLSLISIRYFDLFSLRNILASSIFGLGLYLELIKKKKWALSLYIISVMIHSICFIYIFIRILSWLYLRCNKVLILSIVLLVPTIIMNFSLTIARILANNLFLLSLYNRLTIYMLGNSGIELNSTFRNLYLVFYLIVLLSSLILKKKFKNLIPKQLYAFVLILTLFSLTFINQREMFNRQRLIYEILMLILVGNILIKTSGNKPLSIIINKRENLLGCGNLLSIIPYLFGVFFIIYFIFLVKGDYSFYNNYFIFIKLL